MECLKTLVPYNILIRDPYCENTELIEITEEWKDIPWYEGYYMVSSFGRVISTDRVIDWRGTQRYLKSQIIASQKVKSGYVILQLHKLKKIFTAKIHALVGICFVENPLMLTDINHIDLDKSNNYFWNIEWSTERENASHRDLNKGKKTSKYIRVHFCKERAHLSTPRGSTIHLNKKKINLGYCSTEEEAAIIYQNKLKENNIINKYST